MHDGDTTNLDKDWFKQQYLELVEEPTGSPRWTRPDGAIYTSYYLDSKKKVKIILLDIHYNRQGSDDLGSQCFIRFSSKRMAEKRDHGGV